MLHLGMLGLQPQEACAPGQPQRCELLEQVQQHLLALHGRRTAQQLGQLRILVLHRLVPCRQQAQPLCHVQRRPRIQSYCPAVIRVCLSCQAQKTPVRLCNADLIALNFSAPHARHQDERNHLCCPCCASYKVLESPGLSTFHNILDP